METRNKDCGLGRKPLEARVGQEEIAAVYDRIAPVYDLWGWFTETRARDRALELAGIVDGQEVLEVAVGTGLIFEEIVKRNPHGTNLGIDLSRGMLARAQKRLARLPEAAHTLMLGSALAIALPDDFVDTLVNCYMFDLLPFADMDRVLAEFRRVLKMDGKLVLVNMTAGEGFGSNLYDRLYRLSPRLMGGCRGVQLAERLGENGFTVASREYVQQLLFPSEVILARKRGDDFRAVKRSVSG